jgi:hypothetical protein
MKIRLLVLPFLALGLAAGMALAHGTGKTDSKSDRKCCAEQSKSKDGSMTRTSIETKEDSCRSSSVKGTKHEDSEIGCCEKKGKRAEAREQKTEPKVKNKIK